MNKMSRCIKKHSTTALTILGGIGMIGTAILAAKATPEAIKLIDKAREKKGEELTIVEKTVAVAPSYIPTVISGIATLCCIFGANTLNKRNQASLVSAYALLDRSYREYKGKLIELHGKEAHDEIMDSIALEHAEDRHLECCGLLKYNTLNIENNNEHPILFYDTFSKRYFEKKMSDVIQAEYHLNRNFVLNGGEINLNMFYDFLGLEQKPEYEHLIWIVTDYMSWIDFDHRKITLDDGLECILIEFDCEPMLFERYELEGYL